MKVLLMTCWRKNMLHLGVRIKLLRNLMMSIVGF